MFTNSKYWPLALLGIVSACYWGYHNSVTPQDFIYSFDLEFINPEQASIKGKIGEYPLDVAIDTGSGKNNFELNGPWKESLILTGKTHRYKNLNGDVFHTEGCIVPEFSLGSWKFNAVDGVVKKDFGVTLIIGAGEADEDESSYEYRAALGRPFFKDSIAVFDYQNQKIVMASKMKLLSENGYDVESWHSFPYRQDEKGNGIIIDAQLGENKAPFVFALDTGSGRNIIRLDTPEAEGCGENGVTHLTCTINDSFVADQRVNFGEFAIFNIDFPCNLDGLLGHTFFEKNVVAIDFIEKKIYVK